MKGDPLDLESLLEPVHRHDVVVAQPPGIIDMRSTPKVRKKFEGGGRRTAMHSGRSTSPYAAQTSPRQPGAAPDRAGGTVARAGRKQALPPFRSLPLLRAYEGLAPVGEVVDGCEARVEPLRYVGTCVGCGELRWRTAYFGDHYPSGLRCRAFKLGLRLSRAMLGVIRSCHMASRVAEDANSRAK